MKIIKNWIKKITDKYEFILEEFIKIYEKYNEDNHNELNYLIDNHYLYKEEKKTNEI